VQDGAGREDVADRVGPLALRQRSDLGSDVAGSTAPVEQILLRVYECGQAEVGDDGF
jgi:hypothetical protein